MVIKHIEMTAHPGGLTRLNIVVAGDRSQIAKTVGKVRQTSLKLRSNGCGAREG